MFRRPSRRPRCSCIIKAHAASQVFRWGFAMRRFPTRSFIPCLLICLACLPAVVRCTAVAAEPAWKEVVVTDDWKKAPVGDKGFLWLRSKSACRNPGRAGSSSWSMEAIDDAREIYFGGKMHRPSRRISAQLSQCSGRNKPLQAPRRRRQIRR